MRVSALFALLSAVAVLAHPPVSHPHRDSRSEDNEVEDLYANNPYERPLHTTVLMAQAIETAAPLKNDELKKRR